MDRATYIQLDRIEEKLDKLLNILLEESSYQDDDIRKEVESPNGDFGDDLENLDELNEEEDLKDGRRDEREYSQIE